MFNHFESAFKVVSVGLIFHNDEINFTARGSINQIKHAPPFNFFINGGSIKAEPVEFCEQIVNVRIP